MQVHKVHILAVDDDPRDEGSALLKLRAVHDSVALYTRQAA